uniref:Uncharacterized protein n=1 Tax=uncultured Rhodobacterales bacterium HF4000_03E16 TaxID=710785 RepID=E0XV76_9RHOB|nr:hypothetical protein [uncultured Rhodobacterales bacterium HF4000_03E16]
MIFDDLLRAGIAGAVFLAIDEFHHPAEAVGDLTDIRGLGIGLAAAVAHRHLGGAIFIADGIARHGLGPGQIPGAGIAFLTVEAAGGAGEIAPAHAPLHRVGRAPAAITVHGAVFLDDAPAFVGRIIGDLPELELPELIALPPGAVGAGADHRVGAAAGDQEMPVRRRAAIARGLHHDALDRHLPAKTENAGGRVEVPGLDIAGDIRGIERRDLHIEALAPLECQEIDRQRERAAELVDAGLDVAHRRVVELERADGRHIGLVGAGFGRGLAGHGRLRLTMGYGSGVGRDRAQRAAQAGLVKRLGIAGEGRQVAALGRAHADGVLAIEILGHLPDLDLIGISAMVAVHIEQRAFRRDRHAGGHHARPIGKVGRRAVKGAAVHQQHLARAHGQRLHEFALDHRDQLAVGQAGRLAPVGIEQMRPGGEAQAAVFRGDVLQGRPDRQGEMAGAVFVDKAQILVQPDAGAVAVGRLGGDRADDDAEFLEHRQHARPPDLGQRRMHAGPHRQIVMQYRSHEAIVMRLGHAVIDRAQGGKVAFGQERQHDIAVAAQQVFGMRVPEGAARTGHGGLLDCRSGHV